MKRDKRRRRARAAFPAQQPKETPMFGNERRLARIEGRLDHLINLQLFFARNGANQMSAISDAVANIKTKVTGLATVVDGVGVTLATLSGQVKDLTAKLAESGDVPAALTELNQLSTAIDEQSAELQAGIVANTPAAGETPTPPPDVPPA
jgi:hypothetical protein